MEGGHSDYKKGLWSAEEDQILVSYVKEHGIGNWNRIAKVTGLKRCGKSCRLRWMNYLSPTVKRGDFSEDEEDLIIRLHRLLGNRWSLIAGRVPGRTDNQVKNYWNTHLSKKLGFKRKRKVFSPPKTLPDQPNQNPTSPSEPKSKQALNVSDGREEGEGGKSVQQTRSPRAESMQEIIMSDDFQSSFWCGNNEYNLYSTCLTDTFHDNLVDMDWAALYKFTN